ncbi:MAG: hypothetical protein IT210_07795 [Armatimonadetes bacterium]|nr:hypothetical protein [Armatimonadota bacterium]
MGTAYTPGLKVSAKTAVRKVRRLPLKGQALAEVGSRVESDTVVARTELPGILQTVKVSETLGIEPGEVEKLLKKKVGEAVAKEESLIEIRSFFGLFKSECKSPVEGTLEIVTPTGHVGIRQKPSPVEVKAYVRGTVVEVMAGEGVVVETVGAFIQGIFGVGGEHQGRIRMLAAGPDRPLTEDLLDESCRGQVVVGGSAITGGALRKAAQAGVAGIVIGGIVDKDLIDFLGYDIGVAITGHENIPFALIVTEGFGAIQMAERTFRLLKSLEGRTASVHGATQIRAGVIRPEIIVPTEDASPDDRDAASGGGQQMDIGTPIRLIREPYFGMLAAVAALPPELAAIPSGALVRILEARLENGQTVTVPRANVEIIEA